MTFLTVAMTAMTLLFTPVADEPECRIGTTAEFTQFFANHSEFTGGKMAAGDVAKIVSKMGPPPDIEGDFDLYRYTTEAGDPTVLFVVEGACVQLKVVLPTQQLDNILNDVKAKGERID